MLTAQTSRTSDEYVLDQLAVVEEKLMKLQEDLDGTDLNETLRQMEEGEVNMFTNIQMAVNTFSK